MTLVKPAVLVAPPLTPAPGAHQRRVVVADHHRLVHAPLGETERGEVAAFAIGGAASRAPDPRLRSAPRVSSSAILSSVIVVSGQGSRFATRTSTGNRRWPPSGAIGRALRYAAGSARGLLHHVRDTTWHQYLHASPLLCRPGLPRLGRRAGEDLSSPRHSGAAARATARWDCRGNRHSPALGPRPCPHSR